MQRLVQQPVQVEHVRATAGEQPAHDPHRRISPAHLATLEINQQRRSLRRILRLPGKLRKEPRDAVADCHGLIVAPVRTSRVGLSAPCLRLRWLEAVEGILD